MVADKVRVSVFGKIRNNLYSAFVSKDNEQSRSAYVISQNKVKNDFEGIVIAVAEFDGLFGKRLIVSPPGEIYYEHDLRRQLSKLKNIKLKKLFINMLKVLCCLLPSIVNGLIYILY